MTLRAGTSVVTITPPLGTALAGSFTYREARTIEDDLAARSLVLDDGEIRIAVVVCDIICITAETVSLARASIAERTGILPERVMISCTHTHTGPATAALLAVDPDAAYLAWLAQRIADGVAVAASRLEPAHLAAGSANVGGVCFNRRFRMRDGTVVFNPGLANPDIIEPTGPTDPQVTSLLLERPDGTPIALWSNLSLHYVGTDDSEAVSADYYGRACRFIGDWLGDGCVGMISNGTSGNINNVDVHGAPVASYARQSAMVARAVAAAAIQATAAQPRTDDVRLAAETIPLTVERRPITSDDVGLARQILAQPAGAEADEDGFSFVVGQPIPASQVRQYACEVLQLAEMPERITTELHIIRIGDVLLVGLPGEIFVEFGLALKARSPYAVTAVVSLANDYVGYVPTQEAFAEGAYETWAARSAWPAPGTGEAMVDAVLARIRAGDLITS